jgi:hypothetical protein
MLIFWMIQLRLMSNSGFSGSGSDKKFRINANPDPQHYGKRCRILVSEINSSRIPQHCSLTVLKLTNLQAGRSGPSGTSFSKKWQVVAVHRAALGITHRFQVCHPCAKEYRYKFCSHSNYSCTVPFECFSKPSKVTYQHYITHGFNSVFSV